MADFPRYIPDKPRGIDEFEGNSQSNLSKVIADYITSNNILYEKGASKIIGVEGNWGVGKTNVVKLVKSELSEKGYYFFEYDAWGNQEELQRRSFLEQFTQNLVKDGVVEGKCEIKTRRGEVKSITWPERQKYLFARKVETEIERYPRLSFGLVGTFLAVIMSPVFAWLSNEISTHLSEHSDIAPSHILCIKIVVSLLPIILLFVIWLFVICCNWKNRKKYNLAYFLSIFQDKVESSISYELISEEEPTVDEFKKWLVDVSNCINKKKYKKIVIVYDNMDRLPSEKVRMLWSSIHTFFADMSYENIWVIIPFDKENLFYAFNETNDEKHSNTQDFIDKVFPVVYRVYPPVITDYRMIFTKFFNEAFGDAEKSNEEIINRLYRLRTPQANIRRIIVFINNMVSLYKVHEKIGNRISLKSIAIYLLCINERVKDELVVDNILSGDYLGSIDDIIHNDDNLIEEIAALVYGINVNIAKQIPLTEYINNCIDNGDDINRYCEFNNFDIILKEVYNKADVVKFPQMIECLKGLNKDDGIKEEIWESMASRLIMQPLLKQELPKPHKELLLLVSPNKKKKIVEYLCNSWYNYGEFSGTQYVKCFKQLKLIEGTSEHIVIQPKSVTPSVFIDAVKEAKEEYSLFRLQVKAEDVDKYLSEISPELYKESEIVEILKLSKFYDFPLLLKAIKQHIIDEKFNENNIGHLFSTFRCLSSKNTPLEIHPDLNRMATFLSQMRANNKKTLRDGYIDAMSILLINQPNSLIISTIEEEEIPYVADVIEYYSEISELFVIGIRFNNKGLRNILKYIIQNNLGIKMDFKVVLPLYTKIKEKCGVNDEELLCYFNNWPFEVSDDSAFTEMFIKNIIPDAEFYKESVMVRNNFTNAINNYAVNVLQKCQTTEQLFRSIESPNNKYWHQLIEYMIEDNEIVSQFSFFNELAGKVYQSIISATTPISAYKKKIIEYSDGATYVDIISDVINKHCTGRAKMSCSKFLVLEKNMRLYGELQLRANDVANKILLPVIRDLECKKIILNNAGFYRNLISCATEKVNLIRALKAAWNEGEYSQIIEGN